jgi:elongation factor G
MNVVEVAIEVKTEGGRDALDAALDRLRERQPSIGIRLDTESGEIRLSGMSEDELKDAVASLGNIDVRAGAPQVLYREALSKRIVILHTHKRQIAGGGEFAEVKIEFEPLPLGSGLVFENGIISGAVPTRFIPAIEEALKSEAENGALVGFPIDVWARLVDGKYHEIDSRSSTFEIAARAAFRKLATQGVVEILEPIMKVEVVTPDDYFGNVVNDLNSRGLIQGVEARGNAQAVSALAPTSHMLGYSVSLAAATNGQGQCTMTYDHHEIVPNRGGEDPRFPGAGAARVA